jgi:DNA-binding MarR family transcriptional regulator
MAKKDVALLFERNMRIMRTLADRTEPLGDKQYSHHQIEVLVKLRLDGGRMRLKDIAKRFGTSPSALCLMFGQLEKKGLILREVDEKDRRNTYYSLTKEGKAAANKILEKFRRHVAAIFEPLSKEEDEKIIHAFAIINEILEKQL